eukprot:253419-Chlamydomonas_euryale.AAC.7
MLGKGGAQAWRSAAGAVKGASKAGRYAQIFAKDLATKVLVTPDAPPAAHRGTSAAPVAAVHGGGDGAAAPAGFAAGSGNGGSGAWAPRGNAGGMYAFMDPFELPMAPLAVAARAPQPRSRSVERWAAGGNADGGSASAGAGGAQWHHVPGGQPSATAHVSPDLKQRSNGRLLDVEAARGTAALAPTTHSPVEMRGDGYGRHAVFGADGERGLGRASMGIVGMPGGASGAPPPRGSLEQSNSGARAAATAAAAFGAPVPYRTGPGYSSPFWNGAGSGAGLPAMGSGSRPDGPVWREQVTSPGHPAMRGISVVEPLPPPPAAPAPQRPKQQRPAHYRPSKAAKAAYYHDG